MRDDQQAELFFSTMMSIDYTEITGLDDLHQPEGVIGQAQRLAADCFGATHSFFLIGGSTVGNLAMMTAICEPGDLILVQRNVHKSILNGLMLAGARAVFVPPRWDSRSGVAAGVRLSDVQQALRLYPEAKGLVLTNPNYYGMGIDLAPFAELLHAYGKPLLVDEAHGAHYGFHPGLPKSALACGADVVVQSTHKMLSAMTMGAMLHVKGHRVDDQRIRQRLTMLQSSSPSYPILASLDLARRLMHVRGVELMEQGLQVVQGFVSRLKGLGCIGMLPRASDSTVYETMDPFKVTIHDATATLTGPELREELERRGCFVEMADSRNVLLVFSFATTTEDAERLFEAIAEICHCYRLHEKLQAGSGVLAELPGYHELSSPVSFQLQGFDQAERRLVSLAEAVGRCSAEMIIPYPPGIPVVYPGERITRATALYLQKLAELGIRFHGTLSGRLEQIQVFGEV